MLRALVDFYAAQPGAVSGSERLDPGSDAAVRAAVTYVAGMTDRYAFDTAVRELDWPRERLPQGIDRPY